MLCLVPEMEQSSLNLTGSRLLSSWKGSVQKAVCQPRARRYQDEETVRNFLEELPERLNGLESLSERNR